MEHDGKSGSRSDVAQSKIDFPTTLEHLELLEMFILSIGVTG